MLKNNGPGCPCCHCGSICITVCRGSTVTLIGPGTATQTQSASGLAERQEICFEIPGSGTYTVQVTNRPRLADFSHTFHADCQENIVAYTPTPAAGYRGFPCGGCCLPVNETLYYSDGTNSVKVTYSDVDPVWGVQGWGGCGLLNFTGGDSGELCEATGDCGDVGLDCNGGFGDCHEHCSDLIPVPAYVFLGADCNGSVIAMRCVAVGAPGGPFNNCWLTGPGDDCGAMTPEVNDQGYTTTARHPVGTFGFAPTSYPGTLPQPSVTCPPAFVAFDPNGGLGKGSARGGDTDCFRTSGGVVLTETPP